MAIAKKEIEYAKEIDEALVLVIELVKDLAAKKDIATIAAENLPNLMAAMGGIDQAGAEFKANQPVAFSTIGFRAGELAAAFIGG